MKVPRLNRHLVLEAPERLSDGAGGFVEGWVPLGMLWGEVTPRTGRETAQIGAPVSRVSFRIVVRGAVVGAPDRPMPEHRFRDGTRVFAIEAVTEHDSEGRYLVCFADEEVIA